MTSVQVKWGDFCPGEMSCLTLLRKFLTVWELWKNVQWSMLKSRGPAYISAFGTPRFAVTLSNSRSWEINPVSLWLLTCCCSQLIPLGSFCSCSQSFERGRVGITILSPPVLCRSPGSKGWLHERTSYYIIRRRIALELSMQGTKMKIKVLCTKYAWNVFQFWCENSW